MIHQDTREVNKEVTVDTISVITARKMESPKKLCRIAQKERIVRGRNAPKMNVKKILKTFLSCPISFTIWRTMKTTWLNWCYRILPSYVYFSTHCQRCKTLELLSPKQERIFPEVFKPVISGKCYEGNSDGRRMVRLNAWEKYLSPHPKGLQNRIGRMDTTPTFLLSLMNSNCNEEWR